MTSALTGTQDSNTYLNSEMERLTGSLSQAEDKVTQLYNELITAQEDSNRQVAGLQEVRSLGSGSYLQWQFG